MKESSIVPSEHEKSEWSRMAQDCYGRDLNAYGHRYSGAAALRKGESMLITVFDAMQTDYRVWLIDGAGKLLNLVGGE